jgi:hypothetical protein
LRARKLQFPIRLSSPRSYLFAIMFFLACAPGKRVLPTKVQWHPAGFLILHGGLVRRRSRNTVRPRLCGRVCSPARQPRRCTVAAAVAFPPTSKAGCLRESHGHRASVLRTRERGKRIKIGKIRLPDCSEMKIPMPEKRVVADSFARARIVNCSARTRISFRPHASRRRTNPTQPIWSSAYI